MSLDWLSNAQKKDSTELSLLSANATFLLNEGSKKKKSKEMKLYLLQKQAALRIYLHQVWPLPVWLGGRYTNVVKPSYSILFDAILRLNFGQFLIFILLFVPPNIYMLPM